MSNERIVPNNILLPEIGKLLKEGHNIVMKVKGNSMLPFIHHNKDSVLLVPPSPELIYEGSIILAHTTYNTFVLHRIVNIDKQNGIITLMGDGNLQGTEQCFNSEVLGVAKKVIYSNGKELTLGDEKELKRARIWRKLLPIRRYLLAIYKRL